MSLRVTPNAKARQDSWASRVHVIVLLNAIKVMFRSRKSSSSLSRPKYTHAVVITVSKCRHEADTTCLWKGFDLLGIYLILTLEYPTSYLTEARGSCR